MVLSSLVEAALRYDRLAQACAYLAFQAQGKTEEEYRELFGSLLEAWVRKKIIDLTKF